MSHQFKLDRPASGCGADPQSAIVPMHWPSWLRGPQSPISKILEFIVDLI
jgi:hypothetical protein